MYRKNRQIVVSGFEIIESKKDNGRGYFIAIPTEKVVGTKIKYEEKYTLKKPEEEKNKNRMVVIEKPIIYLYPIKEEKINVKLLNENLITHSYPKYNNKWEVLAKPNGDLIDLKTGRNLYSLYYESIAMNDLKMNNEGFIVKGENSINFLEEKLKILGLTEREAEEFIIYWLPKLESNKYNYIRFATNDELDKIMPIEINPNPDAFIRINMIFKGLEEPINIIEQKLQTPKRDGFVVVEWGGTEIK